MLRDGFGSAGNQTHFLQVLLILVLVEGCAHKPTARAAQVLTQGTGSRREHTQAAYSREKGNIAGKQNTKFDTNF